MGNEEAGAGDAPLYRQPRQARSRQTFEALLDSAGTLLAEVGIERLSTNIICERAGLTPPAFYRYFDDKYAIVAALADRLMARQNVVLDQWAARWRGHSIDELSRHGIDLIRETAIITDGEPGALWIMRAMRAVPRLSEIGLAARRYVETVLTDLYAGVLLHVPRDVIARRTRLAMVFAYSLGELARESPEEREMLFEDARPIFEAMGRYEDYH